MSRIRRKDGLVAVWTRGSDNKREPYIFIENEHVKIRLCSRLTNNEVRFFTSPSLSKSEKNTKVLDGAFEPPGPLGKLTFANQI